MTSYMICMEYVRELEPCPMSNILIEITVWRTNNTAFDLPFDYINIIQ